MIHEIIRITIYFVLAVGISVGVVTGMGKATTHKIPTKPKKKMKDGDKAVIAAGVLTAAELTDMGEFFGGDIN